MKYLRIANPWTRGVLLACCLSFVFAFHAKDVGATLNSARSRAMAYALALVSDGFSVRDEFFRGFLERGEKTVVSMTLYEGNSYVLVGGGCDDCHDLDILLYDEDFNLISRDSLEDAMPVVRVTPRWTGTFHVVIKMYNSTWNGAHWVLVTAYK